MAIGKLAGKISGFYPKVDDILQAKIDGICCAIEDVV